MGEPAMYSKRMWRWFRWTTAVIVLLFCVLILPTLGRKARLIRHIDEVGGFFYSYHSPTVRKLLGRNRYKIKSFLVPKLEPVLGRNWPGMFKDITHVEIDLRNGGSEWDLGVLRHQHKVHWLDIGELEVENEELEVLETLSALRSLHVNITRLGPEGFATIANLENVRVLALSGRELTEKEALMISQMELSRLKVERTEPVFQDPGVSSALELLKKKYPDCQVSFEVWFYPF